MKKHFDTPPRSRSWLNTTVAAVLLTSGCGSEDSGRGIGLSFSQADSAGISILTTTGESALAPLEWIIDSVPDLVIGSEGAPGEPLYRVQGVRGFEDGRILVVDGGSRQLRFFDPQGRMIHRIGRRGEGPGEFRDPILVPLIGIDSLLVWDRYLQRFQYFSEDGQANRTLILRDRWPAGGRPPQGAVGPMMLLDEWEIDWYVPASQQTHGPKETGVHLMWYDPVSGSRVPIASHTVIRNFHFLRPGRPPILEGIPFTVLPSAAVTRNAGFVTDGVAFEVREHGFEGDLRRILRLDLAGRPIAESVREAWLVSELPEGRSGTGLQEQVLTSIPIPETLPAFDRLLTDESGYLWAQIYEWDPTEPKRWVVFDEDGRAVGTVETPPGLRVEWIGPDAILGIWKDDLEIEYVRRHRLRRD